MSGAAISAGWSGALAGGEVGAEGGAEAGALAGPLGAAVGLVIGGLIGLGIGYAAKNAISNANSQATANLSSSTTATPCADCGDGPDCFEPPDDADPDAFDDQLQEQQDAINNLSPDELLNRLAQGDARKAATGSYRSAGDAARRAAARNSYYDSSLAERAAELQSQGMPPEQAAAEAERLTKTDMASLDATHELDFIAGGDGSISGLGDSSVNRSIGSQWGKSGPNSVTSRREQLRKAAEKAKAEGKDKMDVDLEQCDE